MRRRVEIRLRDDEGLVLRVQFSPTPPDPETGLRAGREDETLSLLVRTETRKRDGERWRVERWTDEFPIEGEMRHALLTLYGEDIADEDAVGGEDIEDERPKAQRQHTEAA